MAIARRGESEDSNENLETKIELLFSEITHVKQLIEQRLDQEKEARDKQGAEYERRLSELNESRAEAREKFNDYLDKNQYRIQHDEVVRRVEMNNSQLISMSVIPGDVRALYTWKDDVSKVLARIEEMGVNLRTLIDFKENLGNIRGDVQSLISFKNSTDAWRNKVIGIAIGAGLGAGGLGGFLVHVALGPAK